MVLRAEIGRTSVAATARRLGLSATTVSLVSRGRYPAAVDQIAERVNEVLMAAQVECPARGQITESACSQYRAAPISTSTPEAVRLYAACRRCARNGGSNA